MSTDLVTAITTALTSVQTDCFKVIAVIVPIALAVGGTVFVIRRAFTWFKSLAKG